VAHVLQAESRPNGLTVVKVATSATTIITLNVRTEEWYRMTADALDAVVRLALSEQRPSLRRR